MMSGSYVALAKWELENQWLLVIWLMWYLYYSKDVNVYLLKSHEAGVTIALMLQCFRVASNFYTKLGVRQG